jgi:hypothetical protein
MRSFLVFAAAALILSACARSSAIPIGSSPPAAALPVGSDVQVFTSERDITVPFRVVGLVSYTDPGKYQILTLGSAIEPLKEKARELGANGIIIDRSERVKSGIISTGIAAEARAIRLGE